MEVEDFVNVCDLSWKGWFLICVLEKEGEKKSIFVQEGIGQGQEVGMQFIDLGEG